MARGEQVGEHVLPVDLVVNTYERTYRETLTPGFAPDIEAQNRCRVAARWVLVNNVADRADAERRADPLVRSGELAGVVFVADLLRSALATTGVPSRALRRRGYFLDYGLAMTRVGSQPYLLGWDPETRLWEPADWLTDAVTLLASDRRVFSASPRWPRRDHDSLPEETVTQRPPWSLNYGFSDQCFLVRRSEVAAPIYGRVTLAGLARHSHHPGSFESRLESYQRSRGRYRATHTEIGYETADLGSVIARTGGFTTWETLRRKGLTVAYRGLARLGSSSPGLRVP